MYNASATIQTMLHSICGQSYDSWRIILIDDVSSNEEKLSCKEVVDHFKWLAPEKIVLHQNNVKRWEVYNVLYGIRNYTKADDIVCRIDCDDWLTDLDALAFLNEAYKRSNAEAIWTMHRWGFTNRNISGPMSPDADPYKHPWVSSHLKTFRRKLIDGVPFDNFTNMDGDIIKRAGDQAIYLPVLHNTKKRGFMSACFYHYTINEQGGAVYQTADAKFQKQEADFLRQRGYVSEGVPWEEKIEFNS
jgi:glycosyltransferase involved in cell wall biosynthesis